MNQILLLASLIPFAMAKSKICTRATDPVTAKLVLPNSDYHRDLVETPQISGPGIATVTGTAFVVTSEIYGIDVSKWH
jgi:hypothetical protein